MMVVLIILIMSLTLMLTQTLNIGWMLFIMATVSDLQAKLDTLTATIDAERSEVLAALEGLRVMIQDLRDRLDAAASPEELDALAERLDAEVARVQGVITPEDVPA